MIPMSCPNCGRRGTVPPDRLNTRMHCKKCDAVFHMDSSGKIMLGEPGGKKRAPKKAEGRSKDEPTDYIGLLAASKTFRAILAVAAVGLVIYLLSGPVMRTLFGPGAPQGVPERTQLVADKFADADPGAIRAITTSATQDDIDKWYELRHPKLKFDPPQRPGNQCLITVYQVAQDDTAGNAHWIATIMPPEQMPVVNADGTVTKPEKPEPVNLDVFWTRDGGKWYIDGTQTLKAGQEADTKEKAAEKTKKK